MSGSTQFEVSCLRSLFSPHREVKHEPTNNCAFSGIRLHLRWQRNKNPLDLWSRRVSIFWEHDSAYVSRSFRSVCFLPYKPSRDWITCGLILWKNGSKRRLSRPKFCVFLELAINRKAWGEITNLWLRRQKMFSRKTTRCLFVASGGSGSDVPVGFRGKRNMKQEKNERDNLLKCFKFLILMRQSS